MLQINALNECYENTVGLQRNRLLPFCHFTLQHLQPSRLSQDVYDYKQLNVLYIKFHSKSIKCARDVAVGF